MLELDSPGVVVTDADFNRFAARLVDSKVPVSAWVGTGSQASGGAAELLAVLDETSMAPGSAMGDVGTQRLSEARFGDLFAGRKAKALDHELSAGEARDVQSRRSDRADHRRPPRRASTASSPRRSPRRASPGESR